MQVETIDERYQRLKPETTEFEKKNNAEILTPQNIVVEMLDKFEELCPGKLKNKDFKIIEPCCGKGAFLIELYKRRGSLEGISFNDINIVNVQFCNLLFQTNKGTNLDALKIDYSNYDLVITNPPYNSGKKSIYQQFCEKFQQSKYQCLLIPSKFLYQENQFNFNNTFIKKYNDSKLFDNVEIVVLFYIRGENIKSNLQKPSIKNNLQIIKDIYKIQPNDKRLSIEKINDDYIKCYTSSYQNKQIDENENYYKYIDKKQIKNNDFYKLILIHKIRNQFKWILVQREECYTNSFIGFKFEKEEDAQKYLLLLNNKDLQLQIQQSSFHSRDINEFQLQCLQFK